jgi:hypothetical protein
LITSFENVIDGVLKDTIDVLQQAQRDAVNLINSPIEILKASFEDMAHRRVESVFHKIENEILTFREVLEQTRALIVDEDGYMQFSYSQEDLTTISELKTTADIMSAGLLDEVTNVILHFSDALMEPINRIKDQILLSLATFLGGKDSALYTLLESKINEILKIYTTDELDDLMGDLYSLMKNNIASMKDRVTGEMGDIVNYLTDTESLIK